jgi:hypothetical protein
MALKTGFSALALGALLFGTTAAYADDDNGWQQESAPAAQDEAARSFHGQQAHGADGWSTSEQWNDHNTRDSAFEVHVHTGGCNHGPQPQPPPRQRGRYELQTVQRWVDGYHHQVWVPEQCHYKPHRRVKVCRGGYYEQQWVPGRYETVQEWVWVPGPRWNRHGRGRHGHW